MIFTLKLIAVILLIVWHFLWICYCLIEYGPNRRPKPLNFWQFIDLHFYGVYAKGLKVLDMLVKIWWAICGIYLIYWLWQLF